MINLDSILKSRDIPLSTKVHLVKAMFFHLWEFVIVTKGSDLNLLVSYETLG